MAKSKSSAYVEKVKIKNKLKEDGFRLPHGYDIVKRTPKKKTTKKGS